ncbi:GNAT family N-acetyltransferase [Longitalea luteola]|uniref:GNAT family N-acetyltransferase n=1 Tax=Longitalea luteola TaxID=2812563 RepID=UPI001A96418C|nr:GNAT family N-acetyltransferase [Longitalea luteola]
MECRRAVTKADIEFCKEAILEFRRNLNPDTVVEQVVQMMRSQDFELVFIPNTDNTRAGAFISYRMLNLLRTGLIIYIDDLFTVPECRNQGYAGTLLDHVTKRAIDEGIKSIHLDSGYALHTAHRLYLNKGYYLACNHFAKAVN